MDQFLLKLLLDRMNINKIGKLFTYTIGFKAFIEGLY